MKKKEKEKENEKKENKNRIFLVVAWVSRKDERKKRRRK